MGYSGAYGWQAAGKGLREIAQFLMANQQAKREREAAAAERAELQGAYSSLLPADDPRQEIAQRYGHLPGIGAQLTPPKPEEQAETDRRAQKDLYDQMMGRTKLLMERGENRRAAGDRQRTQSLAEAREQRLATTAENAAAKAASTGASVSAQRFQADQAYDDAVGRAMLALKKHNGDERLALAELAQATPDIPVGIRVRAVQDAKMGGARLATQERRAVDPLAQLLTPEVETPGVGTPVEPIAVSQEQFDDIVAEKGEAYAQRYFRVAS